MSLYHEAAEILTSSSTEGGSLKSRVFKKKNIKSSPNQLYALVLETSKWSPVLKEVVESAELLKHERKVRHFTDCRARCLFAMREDTDGCRSSPLRYPYSWSMICS